jgi:hypothetical protein
MKQEKAFPLSADPRSAQLFLEYAVQTKGIKGEEYQSFLKIGNATAQSFIDTLDKYSLDAVVFPAWSWAIFIASAGGFPIVSGVLPLVAD